MNAGNVILNVVSREAVEIAKGSRSSSSSPPSSSCSSPSSPLGSRGGTAAPTRLSLEKTLPDMPLVTTLTDRV